MSTREQNYHVENLPQDERSFGALLGRLATDSATLVQNELSLAKKELGEKADVGGRAAAVLVAAGLVGLASIIFFGTTALELLALALPRWSAALIVAVIFLIIAAIVGNIGMNRIRRLSLKPKKTMETLEEDKAWLKKLA